MTDKKAVTQSLARMPHLRAFRRNLADVLRLLEVHSLVANTTAGGANALHVLNKSAVVLLAAS
jgi:hypothetical protein